MKRESVTGEKRVEIKKKSETVKKKDENQGEKNTELIHERKKLIMENVERHCYKIRIGLSGLTGLIEN